MSTANGVARFDSSSVGRRFTAVHERRADLVVVVSYTGHLHDAVSHGLSPPIQRAQPRGPVPRGERPSRDDWAEPLTTPINQEADGATVAAPLGWGRRAAVTSWGQAQERGCHGEPEQIRGGGLGCGRPWRRCTRSGAAPRSVGAAPPRGSSTRSCRRWVRRLRRPRRLSPATRHMRRVPTPRARSRGPGRTGASPVSGAAVRQAPARAATSRQGMTAG